ncbi:MAG: cellulase family glycosylhydrolase [Acidobacteriota bacterium]
MVNPASGHGLRGTVHGGQQPVAGSTIQLYTVGITGDGSSSNPMLSAATKTDAGGNFNITGLYSCSSATYVYITATGGQPTSGGTNPNLALMTALGPCTSLTTDTFISINEVTTVAAVSALAPFMNSATAVGSSSGDASSLQAAFATAAQYADSSSGMSPGINIPSGWTVSTSLINTMADIVATCINTSGGVAGSSTACGQLFTDATLSGAPAPADTITALLNILRNPSANTQDIYTLAQPSAPFQPTLTAAPAAFSPALTSVTDGLQVGPSGLSFADTPVGTSGIAQTVTITNPSSHTESLGAPALAGLNPTDYTLSNACGPTLNPGDSCAVSVAAAPGATGLRSAFLKITSNTPDSPHYVALTTNGISEVDGAVQIAGNHLTRNGVAWIPRGLNFIAFVQPPAVQPGGCDGSTSNNFQTAYNRYQSQGSALFTKLVAWGADTIRFQVSQMGLDAQSTIYSQSFFDDFVQAVQQARASGLNVIVSIQDECQSGDPSPANYPGANNQRVWTELAPLFKNDLGIMFEIYNEPEPPASTANWQTWQSRFNDDIATIRSTGAANVVIADGLGYAATFNGAPDLTDPANQVAYAVHPYFHQANLTSSFWDANWGNFGVTHPVIVTEWTSVANSATSGSGYYCDASTAAQSLAMMNYMQSHGIGMVGFAWDFTGTIFGSVVYYANSTTTTYKISSYAGKNCGDNGYGPGLTIQDWFVSGTVPSSPQ